MVMKYVIMNIMLLASMVVSTVAAYDCNTLPLKNCVGAMISITANCDINKLLPVFEKMQQPDQIQVENLTDAIHQVEELLEGVCVVRPFCQPAGKPCCIKTILDYLDETKIDANTYNLITKFGEHDPCVKSPIQTNAYCIPLMIQDVNNTLTEYFETHSLDEPFNQTEFSSNLDSCSDDASNGGNGCYNALNAGPVIQEFANLYEQEISELASQYNISDFDVNDYLPLCPTSAPTQVGSTNTPTASPTVLVANSAFAKSYNSFIVLISMIVGILSMMSVMN